MAFRKRYSKKRSFKRRRNLSRRRSSGANRPMRIGTRM